MLSKDDITHLKTLALHQAPMLSLYMDVSPAKPENHGKAYVLRAKQALKALEVPQKICQQVQQRLQDHRPQGRTHIVFAGQERLEEYHLQIELPLLKLHQGVMARWGAPYLAPVWFALDQYQPYGVVHMDQQRLRLFVVYLGEIEEIVGAFRALDVKGWRYLGEGQVGTPGHGAAMADVRVMARGGSGKDHYQRRVEEWSQRFFREAGAVLQDHMSQRGLSRLILLGAPEEAQRLLPAPVAEHVLASLSPLATSTPSAAEVLRAVEAEVIKAESQQQEALLGQAREKGVSGLEHTLSLLQEGRLYQLLVPWQLGIRVWVCAQGGVGISPHSARNYCPDQALQEVELMDVLPDLAQRYNTQLEFLRGEAERRLLEELGGLAGMTRW